MERFPMWSPRHLLGMSRDSSRSRASLVSFSRLLELWDSEDQWVGTALASWELLGLGLGWLSPWGADSGKGGPAG